ncbi:Leukotriene A-4 hydrolase [Allomyces javanicus]|nr:Leukotriene A-4 hydrolase [Allomyces javanicus]
MARICPDDPNSFANTDVARTTHIDLHLQADFDQKILHGSVTLTVELAKGADEVVLDTSFIDVQGAALVNENDRVPLEYELHERDAKFGSALAIKLPEGTADEDTTVLIRVEYATTDKCTAGQWLAPEQTVGGVHPYFFTQCQAIHARSLLPCQDTPSLKVTYSASITVAAPLRALMSALQEGESDVSEHGLRTFVFRQPTKIPCYLIAIAIGNLEGIEVGPRSTVYSEPEMVEAAAAEFSEVEKIIEVGEKLVMPYEWGRYDLLVLPSSFPYGGMENPCLTFVTPTLLAGDKSLVDVIVHEFAHSYAGNLVTSKNWQNFWLNEGWTVFLERKFIAELHGEPHRQFGAILGQRALREAIALYGEDHPFTCLWVKLDGEDPDDSFSSVPYEKGFSLLYYLEQLLGEEAFAMYTKAYFKNFAGKSIDTEEWKQFLFDFMDHYFGQEKIDLLKKVDWDAWLHQPGQPPVTNHYDETLARQCIDLADRWDAARESEDALEEFSEGDIADFTSPQVVVFLEKLGAKDPFPHTHIAKMDELYKLTDSHNGEIRLRWHTICLQASYKPIYPHVAQFLSEVGRMKYVRPLFRLLDKAEDGHDLAIETFAKLRKSYHPICATMVAKDLNVE